MTKSLTASRAISLDKSVKVDLFNPMVQIAIFAALLLLVGGFAGAEGFNFGAITGAICGIVSKLSDKALLGAAGFAVIVVFGWNKFIGDSSAFQGIKNAIVGAVVILGASEFAKAIFGGSC